jgi:hypothetical protein
MARRIAYAATSSATGIILPTDLRVVPRSPTGPGVVIMPGGGAMENRFPGAAGESYAVYNDANEDVPVAATGSASGRTDILGIRIDDPQFAGQVPADPLTAKYCRAVLVPSIPTTYPFVPLARIVQPANNGAITAAMITDLRTLIRPRRQRDLYNTQPTAQSVCSSTSYTDWTPQANRDLKVPAWATQVKVVGMLGGVNPATSAATAGGVRFALGSLTSQQTGFDIASSTKQMLLTSDTLAVPASMRGTNQTLKLQAAKNSGQGDFRTDQYSTVLWDVEFLEVPSSD